MMNVRRFAPAAAPAPDLAQRVEAIRSSPSYRLAEEDTQFLESESARASRLALEFARVDASLHEQRIASTVVVFGGSRIVEPRIAQARLIAAEASSGDDEAERAARITRARHAVALSRFYEEARALAAHLPRRAAMHEPHEFVIATGGGPGIMEAANRGACELGLPTVGFNIALPAEQAPNPYITPALAFRFHYFALRKMHFMLRARALVAFPGGYGTLDELFEALNLVETQKMARIPIVLVGADHWRRAVDFDYLLEQGHIGTFDRDLFSIVDSGADAAARIVSFHATKRD